MSRDILQQIMERKRSSPEFLFQHDQLSQIDLDALPAPRDFLSSFQNPGAHIIAEVKRGSPSKGMMNKDLVASSQALYYQQAGASAISVLTEPYFFFGSIQDLKDIKAKVQLPILRKDFLLEPWEVDYSYAIGADAILLIVACHTPSQLKALHQRAKEIGIPALVEVHDEEELEVALELEPQLVGINNRNLKTFHVDLATTEKLLPKIPQSIRVIAESGFHNLNDISRFKDRVHGFLVGEALVTHDDPGAKISEMTQT